jgi:hypothetical protein
MTFVLIELESLEVLQRVGLSRSSLASEEMCLDEGWSRTFIGMYFFVRLGKGPGGEEKVRTRMIAGETCQFYIVCQHYSAFVHPKGRPFMLLVTTAGKLR